jgi:LacI family transcriptional regulator
MSRFYHEHAFSNQGRRTTTMDRKVTIYDIARQAGVSTATVSKVINRTGKISQKTQQKIHQIIRETGYLPNKNASGLSKRQTNTIGLLIPDITNPFFAAMAKEMLASARDCGYDLTVCNTDYSKQKAINDIQSLLQKGIDGLVISSTNLDEPALHSIIPSSKPLVFVSSNDVYGLNVNSVSVDDYSGSRIAIKYLAGLGHRHIALILEEGNQSKERLRGYTDTLRKHDLDFSADYVICAKSSISEGRKAFAKLSQLQPPPSAIFGYNDVLAIGAILEAKSKGLRIPEDVAIIGFDNTIMSEIVSPELTSIDQPLEDMCRRTMELIVSQISRPALQKQHILFAPVLVKRQST